MDKTILVAIVPSLFALVGVAISSIVTYKNNQKTLTANHNATITELKNTNTLITMRMDSMAEEIKGLRTKVESHNQYDRRIVALETKVEILERMTDDGK